MPATRHSSMEAAAGITIMMSSSFIMPAVSNATTEPHRIRMVKGRMMGESMVSSRMMDRHSSTLPLPTTTHIRADTAAGDASSKTRLRVYRGCDGKHRLPIPSASSGIRICRVSMMTSTGLG